MNKQEKIQLKWDKWLIMGWFELKTMGIVIRSFIDEVYGSEVYGSASESTTNEGNILINSKLKRCLLFDENKFVYYPVFYQEVRSFIYERASVLSATLMLGEMSRVEILMDIDSFKFISRKKIKHLTKDQENRKRNEKRRVESTQTIRARKLGSNNGWRIKS